MENSLPRAAIVTALSLERAAVLEHIVDYEQQVHEAGTIYQIGRFSGETHVWEVAVVLAGMHNPAAAAETERIMAYLKPEIVFFCGVAGGIKDVALGDVVAADKVYWFESGKDEEHFKTRMEVCSSSYALVQRACAVAENSKWWQRTTANAASAPKALVKPIAAGAKVVASRESASFKILRENCSDAVAIDMESFGFLRAVYMRHGTQALTVRGISDLVQDKHEADAAGNQPLAARNAAAFTFQVLAEFSPQSRYVKPDRRKEDRTAGNTPMLEHALAHLYPQGPKDREVWSRAGGDIAQLDFTGGSGKAQWHAALRLLHQGGGGPGISFRRLLVTMREDFPKNEVLANITDRL